MAENQAKAVTVSAQNVEQVKHTIKAAKILFSAPPYILRGPIYLVCMITASALVYSFIAEKDQIVAAPLTLVSEYSTVQAPANGIVDRIYVIVGSVIDSYDTPLVDIQFRTEATQDSETQRLKSELDRLKTARQYQGKEKSNLQSRISDLKTTLKSAQKDVGLLEDRIRNERVAFEDELNSAQKKTQLTLEQIKKVELLVNQQKSSIETRQKEYETFEKAYNEELDLFKKQLSTDPEVSAKRLQMIRGKEAVDQAKTAASQSENELGQLKIQLAQTQADPDRIKNDWEAKKLKHSQERSATEDRVSELNSSIYQMQLGLDKDEEQLDKDIKKVEKKIEESINLVQGVRYLKDVCRISSTYSGEILEVLIKPGELIARGQPMLKIKRKTDQIYAEILVQNRDRGNIKKNDLVKIKYEAYPYQEFGIQSGRIDSIPPQPTMIENFGSMYKVRVLLDSPEIEVRKGELQPLALGLQGVGEIKVRSKKIIAVVFSPLSKFLHPEDE